MIYLKLFFEFFKIGMFAFGGAYGAIPLIEEVSVKNGWLSPYMLSNIIAISESTPGPIMVNAASYIGKLQGGITGALVATVGVVLPSFIIILLISIVFKKSLKNSKINMALKGIKLCIIGTITAGGLYMLETTILRHDYPLPDSSSLIILITLALASVLYFKKRKSELSPIALIMLSAIMGCILG